MLSTRLARWSALLCAALLAPDPVGAQDEPSGAAPPAEAAAPPVEGQPQPDAAADPLAAPAAVPPSTPLITQITSRFPPGPYSALATAPGDPSRVAIGTEAGEVAWSSNAGFEVSSGDALLYRKMDPVTLRGQDSKGYGNLSVPENTATAQGRHDDESDDNATQANRKRETQRTREQQRASHRVKANRLHHEAVDDFKELPRSLYTFLDMLEAGLPSGRWHVWMSVSDPVTIVSSLSVPPYDGPLGLATQMGVYLSDSSRAGWRRIVGTSNFMPGPKDEMGLSVGVDPQNPLRVLAATDRALYVSNDGGNTFAIHPDKGIEGAWITRIMWDPNNPALVFLMTPDTIYLSQDGGMKFEPSFSAEGEITDLALSPDAAIVATSDGMYLAYADRLDRQLQGMKLIGAAPWRDGSVITATADELLQIYPDGRINRLRVTSNRDPFLKLAGGGELIWLISRDHVYLVGDRPARLRRTRPRFLLSASEIERAVITHLPVPGGGGLHPSWFAKLIPSVELTVNGFLNRSDHHFRDGTFPFGDRRASATAADMINWTVWANWDIASFAFGGNSHVSNPRMIIESNLREQHKQLRTKIHTAYRQMVEAAGEVERLPDDDEGAVLAQLRFEELVAYLEFMAGRKLVADEAEPRSSR